MSQNDLVERVAPLAIALSVAGLLGVLCSRAFPTTLPVPSPSPPGVVVPPTPSPSPTPTTSPSPAPSPSPPWKDAPPDVLERGRLLFVDRARTACTACHEDGGAGNGPSLLGVADRYRSIFGAREAAADYMKHHIRDPETYPGKTGRVWATRMFAFRPDQLSDEEVAPLVDFLLSRTGSLPVSAEPMAPPSAQRGGEVADRLRCTSCHSAARKTSLVGLFDRWKREKGSSPAAREALGAKLANHPQALPAADVRDLVEFLRLAR